jgi:outer membrane protein insertion porin family
VLRSIRIIEETYGSMGYLDVRAVPSELRSGPKPVVDLLLEIAEGELYKVGNIDIQGNFLTKDKVIRRQIKLRPGRPFDSTQLEESRRRLRNTRLFNDVRITLQDPDAVDPEYRDLLVELKERNTGSVNFGIAVGSDSGVFGDFSIVQNNFDIADVPESFGELITGRAFRGAGQRFNLTFRPGDEVFQYSGSITEPHLFETDLSATFSGLFRKREFSQYDEKRSTGSIGLAHRLGDIWTIGLTSRVERVELTDIDSDAPVDVFQDSGPDNLTSVGVSLTRTTIGSVTRPTEGTRLELSFERVGLLGGDLDFFRAETEYTIFLTIDEDFIGRKSVLRLRARTGYIFGEDGRVPTYERFYLGGRSFRGFEFRTISPKGIRADTGELGDDPVGGKWLLFLGAQYEFPIFEQTVAGVVFLDTGTVTNSVGFDEYRISAGVGVRLYIQQLGPVPIAFDFGFPIVSESGDESRVLSFSAELPF